jgi:hypothetical protein
MKEKNSLANRLADLKRKQALYQKHKSEARKAEVDFKKSQEEFSKQIYETLGKKVHTCIYQIVGCDTTIEDIPKVITIIDKLFQNLTTSQIDIVKKVLYDINSASETISPPRVLTKKSSQPTSTIEENYNDE